MMVIAAGLLVTLPAVVRSTPSIRSMGMIAAVRPLVAGLLNHHIAHAAYATRGRSIHTLRIRAILPIHRIAEARHTIAMEEVAIIIIDTADFTSHLADDGA